MSAANYEAYAIQLTYSGRNSDWKEEDEAGDSSMELVGLEQSQPKLPPVVVVHRGWV